MNNTENKKEITAESAFQDKLGFGFVGDNETISLCKRDIYPVMDYFATAQFPSMLAEYLKGVSGELPQTMDIVAISTADSEWGFGYEEGLIVGAERMKQKASEVVAKHKEEIKQRDEGAGFWGRALSKKITEIVDLQQKWDKDKLAIIELHAELSEVKEQNAELQKVIEGKDASIVRWKKEAESSQQSEKGLCEMAIKQATRIKTLESDLDSVIEASKKVIEEYRK